MIINNKFIKKFKYFKIFNPLRFGLTSKTGRNFLGKITVFTRTNGLQTLNYRLVTYSYNFFSNGFILDVVVDKRRNGFLGLVFFLNGFASYFLLPDNKNLNDKLIGYSLNSSLLSTINFAQGMWSFVSFFPVGSFLYNIELKPFKGGSVCRAAGTSALLLTKIKNFIILKLRSKWKLILKNNCMASFGVVSNKDIKYENIYKAGLVSNKGRKPLVRGVAKNPVDHPHGGGEGKKSKKAKPRTPWGKSTIKTPTKTKLAFLVYKKKYKIF